MPAEEIVISEGASPGAGILSTAGVVEAEVAGVGCSSVGATLGDAGLGLAVATASPEGSAVATAAGDGAGRVITE